MNQRARADFVVLFVGRALQALLGLAAIRVMTSTLDPGEVGRMNLVLSVITWFGMLLISPVGNYVLRKAVEWHVEGRLFAAVGGLFIYLLAVGSVGLLVLYVVQQTVGIGTPMSFGWLAWLIVGNVVLATTATMCNGLLNVVGRRTWYVVLANVTSWLGLGLAWLLTAGWARVAEYWLSGLLLGQLALLVGSVFLLRSITSGRSSVPPPAARAGFNVREVATFAWPLVISTGLYWIETNGYRFLLVRVTDVTTIGLLTTGLTLAIAPLTMFDNLFSEYYRPIFYRDIAFSDDATKAEAWNRYASAYFPAVLLLAAFVGAGGPFLARFLVAAPFRSVAWLASWGALFQVTIAVYAVYVVLTHAALNTRVLIRPAFVGAVTTVILVAALPRWQSLPGAGIAVCAGMLMTLLDTARILHARFPLRVPWRRVGLASCLALPLVLALTVLAPGARGATALEAISALVGGGAYVALAQLMLARQWLLGWPVGPLAPSVPSPPANGTGLAT